MEVTKITTLYIKDTGYIRPGEESGTQETNIVNGGTALPLKGVSISYSRGIKFDNKPTPATYDENRLNFISITNPVVNLSGQIKAKGDLSDDGNVIKQISGVTSITDQDGNSSSDEIDILYLLDKLTTTKGYKELYYNDTSSNNNLLYGLGSVDTFNATIRHLHIMCKGINITQNGSSGLINWQLTCEITKGE